MALSDPLSITIGANTYALPRTSSGEGLGVFSWEDGSIRLTVNHVDNKSRKRARVRLDFSKIVADPLLPSTNVPVSASFTLIMDRPIQGITNADQKDAVMGLLAALSATSGVLTAKILGGES